MAELESTIGIYKVSHMPPSELRNLKRQVLLHEVILLLLIEYSNMLSITFYVSSTHRIPPTRTQLGTKISKITYHLHFTNLRHNTAFLYIDSFANTTHSNLKNVCFTTTANVFTHLSVLHSSVFFHYVQLLLNEC